MALGEHPGFRSRVAGIKARLAGRRARSAQPAAPAFAAFISYSHAVDSELARQLHTGLHRFAKRWSQLRALRVFRDEANLAVDPSLWDSIRDALLSAEHLVLLASPEAARSEWVARETALWVDQHGSDRLLVVLTHGEIVWDREARDFDWSQTTAIPEPLRGAFANEPRYLDLRWARSEESVSLRNPRFRDAIAELAAPMHGKPKDSLIGEDVRQHRRTVRLRRGAVLTLVTLAGVATVAAGLAMQQRNEARSQAALATSRYLAGQALSELPSRPSRSLLMSSEAMRLRDTPEARAALLTGIQRHPQLITMLEDDADRAGAVSEVAYSPDGKRLAAARYDGTAILWDVRSGERIGTPLGGPADPSGTFEDWMTSVAFSPDGDQLATGDGSGKVTLWDAERRRAIDHVEVGAPVGALAYRPGGRVLGAAFRDRAGTIALYQLAGRGRTSVLKAGAEVFSMAFSKDGRYLAAGTGAGRIVIWDMRGRRRLGILNAGDAVQDLAFSPSGARLAAAAGDSGVRLWRIPGRRAERTPAGATGYLYSVAFSPDGRTLAAADGEGNVKLWDAHTGTRMLRRLKAGGAGGAGGVYALAFNPLGGSLATGSGDGNVLLWSVRRRWPLGHALEDAPGPGTAVAFSPREQIVALGGPGGKASLWNAKTREKLADLPPVASEVTSAVFSPNGRILALGDDRGRVTMFDVRARRKVSRPFSAGETVEGMAYSPDGEILAVATVDGLVALWETEPTRPIGKPIDTGSSLEDVEFSPRGDILATANFDSTINLWDVETRQRAGKPLIGHNDTALSVAFSHDGETLASAGLEDTVILWDVDTRRKRGDLTGTDAHTIRFTHDDETLVTATYAGDVRLWDAQTLRRLGSPLEVGGQVNDIDVSPDDTMIVSANETPGAVLWDMEVDLWIATACRLANRNLSRAEWSQFVGSQYPYHSTCGSQSH